MNAKLPLPRSRYEGSASMPMRQLKPDPLKGGGPVELTRDPPNSCSVRPEPLAGYPVLPPGQNPLGSSQSVRAEHLEVRAERLERRKASMP